MNINYEMFQDKFDQQLNDPRITEANPVKLRHIAGLIKGKQPLTAQALRQLAFRKEKK